MLNARLFSLCCFSALIYAACIEAPNQNTHIRNQRCNIGPWTHRFISQNFRSEDRESSTHNFPALDSVSVRLEKKAHVSAKSDHERINRGSRAAMGIRPLVLARMCEEEIVVPNLRRIRGGEGEDEVDDGDDEEKAGDCLF